MSKFPLKTYLTFEAYPNHIPGHTLMPQGRCTCGRWGMVYKNEPALIRSHQFHVLMIQGRPFPATKADQAVSTIPPEYEAMRDAFVAEAKAHPHYAGMTEPQIQRSVDNRLWNILQRRASGPSPLKPGDFVTKEEHAT
jgi:hypothetical protein